jgi:hypothetical protein
MVPYTKASKSRVDKEKEILKMKKVIALMAALVLVTLVGSFAQGQTCYQLKPYIDIINLSHTNVGPNRVLFGNWTAGTQYSLPVVGAREPNINGGPNRVSLNGTNNTSDFGGNLICAIDATVNGPFTAVCVGSSTTFTITGTAFAPVSCTEANPDGESAGKSGKSAQNTVLKKDTILAADGKGREHTGE